MKALVLLIVALAQSPLPTKTEQLQDAARKGDATAVKQLLDSGVDVNTKFRYNATALFFACDAGNVDVVKVLLDHGADMNLKDTFYGFTPLMLAVSPARKKTPAHTEIAKLLIAKGAAGKEDALLAAIDDGDAGLVTAVLDSGGVSPAKMTDALESAKTAKKPEIVAMLEEAGAKPPEEYKIDAALLVKYAGIYRGPREDVEIAIDGTGLTIGFLGAPVTERGHLVAKDNASFRGVGMNGMSFVFQMTGDKVTGFQMVPPQGSPTAYTRVEKP
ncbi:MAG TPA: ankyrin repeat domain-containing protein [Vicinamibacterales bacterium]